MAGRKFHDVRAFHGTWEGVYDGRRARLRIVVTQEAPGTLCTLYLTFTDIDRGETFTGSRERLPWNCHEVGSITLSGAATLFWPSLLIHTGDTDVLSGVSDRSNRRYPMSFHRSATGPSYVRDRPFGSFDDWCGAPVGRARYAGSLDGRRAQLDVDVSSAGSERRFVFHLADLDRKADWYAHVAESEVRRWSYDRQRNPLAGVRMSPYWDRQEPLLIGYMYWHSGNAAYVTGEYVVQGSPYGMSFIRARVGT
ncbi:hypothetical protein AB0F13_13570 [Streptomyces sp. NPDC026206]|uniref:hypothetical protein n=1 Tax=Streptomyces sp. NPDC026206 TaxID=3157089 RepID=UPI0033D3B9F3